MVGKAVAPEEVPVAAVSVIAFDEREEVAEVVDWGREDEEGERTAASPLVEVRALCTARQVKLRRIQVMP